MPRNRYTPQKSRGRSHKHKLKTPQTTMLKDWLLASPSHRHIAWRDIPHFLPELNAKEKAITTAMRDLGYCLRATRTKGFSDDPRVWRERRQFAEQALTWTKERVQRQIFSDEVWAMGGAHTTSFVTCLEDRSDKYLPECLQHKYSKAPAWMFHGCIVNGKKGPAIVWEKEWGSIDSTKYNDRVLVHIAEFVREHAEEPCQDWH